MSLLSLTLALSLVGADPIFYTLPTAGNVSLAIFNSSGQMVRPLLYGQTQAAGEHFTSWDGLDRYGRPAPAGAYQWRLLETPGFSRELLVNVGVTHRWSICDVWPGNHAGPTLVYVDGDDALYVASRSSEGPPHVIKITPDGSKKHWDDGTYGSADGITGMAVVDRLLYLQSGSSILVRDARTGNGVPHPPTSLPAGESFPSLLRATDTLNNHTLKVVGNTIQRFNADGSLAATHGSSRVYGPFNPQQFDTILAIACDSQGNFYTVEQFPRRVARFDSKGNLLNQWIGGLQWGSMAAFDPANPTTAYVPIDHQHWGQATLDFANKSWTLVNLYPLVNRSSWSVGKTSFRDILPAAPNETYFEVRHVGSETYLLNKQNGVLVLRVEAAQLTPVAYLGCLHPTLDAEVLPTWWLAAQNLPATTTFNKVGYTHFSFSWSDTNGNRLVDISEITVASVGSQYNAARVCAVDANWNITLINNANQIATIANTGTATAPKWDWDHWKLTPIVSDGMTPTYRGCYAPGDGTLWALAVATNPAPPATQADWPNQLNTAARLMQFSIATGQQLAATGQWSSALAPPPGNFADPRAILGSITVTTEAKPCLVTMDSSYPGHAGVWTSDGLYAGSFQDDTGYTVSMQWQPWQWLAYGNQRPYYGTNATYTEQGLIYNDAHWQQVLQGKSGTVYFGSMGVNSTPFYEVTGFTGWQRQSGAITVAR